MRAGMDGDGGADGDGDDRNSHQRQPLLFHRSSIDPFFPYPPIMF